MKYFTFKFKVELGSERAKCFLKVLTGSVLYQLESLWTQKTQDSPAFHVLIIFHKMPQEVSQSATSVQFRHIVISRDTVLRAVIGWFLIKCTFGVKRNFIF